MGNAEHGHAQTALGGLLLREGVRSPWTEAISKTRWKPWVWIVWQVSRIALVVLAVVLIGWGTKILVDRQEAMEASEVIALTAVLVTGVGAVFTVAVNAWLGRKRLASEERRHTERLVHEERLQTKRLDYEAERSSERLSHETDVSRDRLAHERAEAVRTTAASAYRAADAVVSHVNQNTVHTLARSEDSEFGARQAISKAMDGLAFVTALGWNAEVRESAATLLDEIDKLARSTWAHVGAIRNGHETTTMMDRQEERESATLEALDAYRQTVAE